tara:strand:+ start:2764 stop:2925 length:162 start_codon:yes stop_codon:yes gene_type:complete
MKIGIFGTRGIDNYNVYDFVKTSKNHLYVYKNKEIVINVSPFGYKTTSMKHLV